MIAIVIPYYKIQFFAETLKSLAAQTDKRFKVYIGDDASPDCTMELLETFKGEIDYSYRRFNKNLGGSSLIKQWERCIDLTGNEEWFMIFGDDDVLGHNAIKEFYENKNKIIDHDVNVVRFASILIDSEGNASSKIYHHPELEKATDSYYKKFIWESRSSLSEYVFKRSSYNEKKFTDYPLGWHSDDKAWLDFAGVGSILTLNEALVKIRRSQVSISGKTDNLNLKEIANIKFYRDILLTNNYTFNRQQRINLLFDFGILISEQNHITFNNAMHIFIQFLKIGSFYNGFRFLRRMYRSKYLTK